MIDSALAVCECETCSCGTVCTAGPHIVLLDHKVGLPRDLEGVRDDIDWPSSAILAGIPTERISISMRIDSASKTGVARKASLRAEPVPPLDLQIMHAHPVCVSPLSRSLLSCTKSLRQDCRDSSWIESYLAFAGCPEVYWCGSRLVFRSRVTFGLIMEQEVQASGTSVQ